MDDKLKQYIHNYISKLVVKIFVDNHFMGTGFFITSDGYILTAYHCIGVPTSNITIKTRFSERPIEAEIDNYKSLEDNKFDILVLKTNFSIDKCLPLGSLQQCSKDDEVVSIGYPAAHRITSNDGPGVYSGKITNFYTDDKFETNVPQGPGHSGGPIYHYKTNTIIGLVLSGYKQNLMRNAGKGTSFKSLFENWVDLKSTNEKISSSWKERLKTKQHEIETIKLVKTDYGMSRRNFLLFTVGLIGGGIATKYISFKDENSLDNIVNYFYKDDYKRLNSIKDIRDWSKENKRINIVNEKGKLDIYRGFIFPLFRMKEVKEIYFYSTSVFWGHATFGPKLCDEAFKIIADSLTNNKSKIIQIISSTSNIESLYNDYSSVLIDTMKQFSYSLNISKKNNIVYCKNFNIYNYTIYLRTTNDECYRVVFGNHKTDKNVTKFDGSITISYFTSELYKESIKRFKEDFIQFNTFDETIRYLRG